MYRIQYSCWPPNTNVQKSVQLLAPQYKCTEVSTVAGPPVQMYRSQYSCWPPNTNVQKSVQLLAPQYKCTEVSTVAGPPIQIYISQYSCWPPNTNVQKSVQLLAAQYFIQPKSETRTQLQKHSPEQKNDVIGKQGIA